MVSDQLFRGIRQIGVPELKRENYTFMCLRAWSFSLLTYKVLGTFYNNVSYTFINCYCSILQEICDATLTIYFNEFTVQSNTCTFYKNISVKHEKNECKNASEYHYFKRPRKYLMSKKELPPLHNSFNGMKTEGKLCHTHKTASLANRRGHKNLTT